MNYLHTHDAKKNKNFFLTYVKSENNKFMFV